MDATGWLEHLNRVTSEPLAGWPESAVGDWTVLPVVSNRRVPKRNPSGFMVAVFGGADLPWKRGR